jgi:hypothetical protein
LGSFLTYITSLFARSEAKIRGSVHDPCGSLSSCVYHGKASVICRAIHALGRTEEAAALRERYGLKASGG